MTAALLGLLLPVAATWIALLASGLRRPADSRLLTAAVAFAVAIGLSSVVCFLLMAHWGLARPWFVAADASLWVAVGAAGWRSLRRTGARSRPRAGAPAAAPRRFGAIDWLVRATFAVVAGMALAAVAAEYLASPHGQWDAWAIWNQKARFLFRGGREWAASMAINWSNPSHPLLVSASVARLWAYAGAELTINPAVLSLAYGSAVAAAVIGVLDVGRPRAWIAGTILVAPGTFVQQMAAQMADLPMALFIVLTLIVLREGTERIEAEGSRAALVLAGILASLGAWTKNEGLVLLSIAAVLVGWTALRSGRVRPIAAWAAGALPVLLIVAWFKLEVARFPPEYFAQAGTVQTMIARFFDLRRHAVVGELMGGFWATWGGPRAAGALPLLMAAAAVAFARAARGVRPTATAIGLMIAAYYVVWILSPLDAVWLISTSFERLLFQLWPALVVTAFSGRWPSDEVSAPVDRLPCP